MKTNDSASQIVKSVSVLMAIRLVAEAWNSVKEETIKKCFAKSGITGSIFFVVSRLYEDEDPFDDIEAEEELHDLYDQISPSDTNCPVEEYINGEGDVPICMQYGDDWEDYSLPILAPHPTCLIRMIKRILMIGSNSTLNHLHQK